MAWAVGFSLLVTKLRADLVVSELDPRAYAILFGFEVRAEEFASFAFVCSQYSGHNHDDSDKASGKQREVDHTLSKRFIGLVLEPESLTKPVQQNRSEKMNRVECSTKQTDCAVVAVCIIDRNERDDIPHWVHW